MRHWQLKVVREHGLLFPRACPLCFIDTELNALFFCEGAILLLLCVTARTDFFAGDELEFVEHISGY